MNVDDHHEQTEGDRGSQSRCCAGHGAAGTPASLLSRRDLLHAAGAGTMGLAMQGLVLGVAGPASAARLESTPGTPSPRGHTLRVKPVLVFQIPTRQEKTSWRWYGGIQTMDEVHRKPSDCRRTCRSWLPRAISRSSSCRWNWSAMPSRPSRPSATPCDAILIFGACSYDQQMCHFAGRLEDPGNPVPAASDRAALLPARVGPRHLPTALDRLAPRAEHGRPRRRRGRLRARSSGGCGPCTG